MVKKALTFLMPFITNDLNKNKISLIFLLPMANVFWMEFWLIIMSVYGVAPPFFVGITGHIETNGL